MELTEIADNVTSLDEAKQFIRELVAINQSLQADVADLKTTIESLQSRYSSSSRNSSKAPSTDSPEQRAERKKRAKSSRKKGAQPGHKKHERATLPENEVDTIHRYFPGKRCHCGGTITANSQPTYRHQVFDLPEVRYQVTEHQLYTGQCVNCQCQQTPTLPDWVPSGQMGGGLISTILQLSGQFHLSIRQIQSYLSECWHLDFSTGAISQAQGKANPWLGVPYRQIAEKVRQSPVAHADETRHYRGTEQRWLWTLSTSTFCFFMVHYSRGKAAANALLGDFNGYLVTDHYSGYTDVPAERRQLCWAHLIRHFIKIGERNGIAGDIGGRLLLISCAVIRTRHRQLANPNNIERYHRRLLRLRKSFHLTLVRGSGLKLAERTRNQCLHLLKDEAMCWTFLKELYIPLTNNLAERAIRPYVIWRKLSFASQSFQGDQFRPMILSIVGTMRCLGVRSSGFLRTLCNEGLRGDAISVQLPLGNTLPAAI